VGGYRRKVASTPIDTSDLPGDIGDELQSLALELYDAAKISKAERRELSLLFYFNYFDFYRQSRLLLLKTRKHDQDRSDHGLYLPPKRSPTSRKISNYTQKNNEKQKIARKN